MKALESPFVPEFLSELIKLDIVPIPHTNSYADRQSLATYTH